MPAYIPEVQYVEKLPVVFAKWIRDTFDRCEKAYTLDTGVLMSDGKLIQNFEPTRFIKDSEDIELCEQLLLHHFPLI